MPTADQVKDLLVQEADSWLRAENLEHLEKLVRNKVDLEDLGVPEGRREVIELARLSAQAMAMQNAFRNDVRRSLTAIQTKIECSST